MEMLSHPLVLFAIASLGSFLTYAAKKLNDMARDVAVIKATFEQQNTSMAKELKDHAERIRRVEDVLFVPALVVTDKAPTVG